MPTKPAFVTCRPSVVKRYMGKRKPLCNAGLGCPACWKKYIVVHGMSDEQAYEFSTPEERRAVDQYRGLQQEAALNFGMWDTTDMLIASQCIPVIVARNQRFGRCE